MFWGTFLIALFVVAIQGVFELSNKESDAVIRLLVDKRAAKAVIYAFRYKKLKRLLKDGGCDKNGKPVTAKYVEAKYDEMKDVIEDFYNIHCEAKKMSADTVQIENQMNKIRLEVIQVNKTLKAIADHLSVDTTAINE